MQRMMIKATNMLPRLIIMKLLSKPISANFSLICSSLSSLGLSGIKSKTSSGMTSKVAIVMIAFIILYDRSGNSISKRGK